MGLVQFGGESLRCDLAAGDHAGRCSWCGAPLPGRRTRWCSDTCGRAFADNHCWTNARQAALERDGFRCRDGCVSLDLHVHHVTPVGDDGYSRGCQHHLDGLVTLCQGHHVEEHRFMRQVAAVLDWAEHEPFTAWSDGTPQMQLRLPLAS